MSGLPHHELFTALGVFVVEEDARAGEQVVAFAIVDSGLVAEQLGSRVRAASPDHARQQHAQGIASPALVGRARIFGLADFFTKGLTMNGFQWVCW